MDELSQPQIGQRCHVPGIGFGTIRRIRGDELRIEFDAGVTTWEHRSEVELLPMPVQQEEGD